MVEVVEIYTIRRYKVLIFEIHFLFVVSLRTEIVHFICARQVQGHTIKLLNHSDIVLNSLLNVIDKIEKCSVHQPNKVFLRTSKRLSSELNRPSFYTTCVCVH